MKESKKQILLEMWKVKKIVAWLDGLFDTVFLVFAWIMGWKILFWIFLVLTIISAWLNAVKIKEMEDKLK